MRLVDTSAWIEFLKDTELGSALAVEFPVPRNWLVPTMVQLELKKFLAREVSERKANEVFAFSGTCVVADLDTAIASAAAEISSQYRLSTADAVIYATAMAYGADLLTCDRHFETLPQVRYMPKA